jgi:hypothetical protein
MEPRGSIEPLSTDDPSTVTNSSTAKCLLPLGVPHSMWQVRSSEDVCLTDATSLLWHNTIAV